MKLVRIFIYRYIVNLYLITIVIVVSGLYCHARTEIYGNQSHEYTVEIPDDYFCYYKWRGEYGEYLDMYRAETLKAYNLIAITQGPLAVFPQDFDNSAFKDNIFLKKDSLGAFGYNPKDSTYYIRKYYPEDNINFIAFRIKPADLVNLNKFIHQITQSLRR